MTKRERERDEGEPMNIIQHNKKQQRKELMEGWLKEQMRKEVLSNCIEPNLSRVFPIFPL